MTQTCSKCRRTNPADASYCYFDGAALDSSRVNGGPIHTGRKAFAHPFVFPSGRVCGNFDQLALACHELPEEATELLREGFLEKFLGNLGRADLAAAAKEAAGLPDLERGLDQFLIKLPTDVIRDPALGVEAAEFNLGRLHVGENRTLQLRLLNQGMRWLYGTISCDNCVWLAVGEAPGTPQKVFRFSDELIVPIQIRGKYLQANRKPLEGRLIIDSNGGGASVIVRGDLPVIPFPTGVLAGARSPRQIAERAKEHPQEAVPLFEDGTIAKWYQHNGWIYPVQSPPASGLGVIQQFFEALGLTPPPKVEIGVPAIELRGQVGDRVDYTLEVKTKERRPVYAHAKSDQPWLQVGRAKLNGRTATIPLTIPQVPDREGETLTAQLTVTANGNQKFVVPVTLEVGGNFSFGEPVGAQTIHTEPRHTEPRPLGSGRAGRSLTVAAQNGPELQKTLGHKRKWIYVLPAALLGIILLLVVLWDSLSLSLFPKTDRKGEVPPFIDPEIAIHFSPDSRRFGIELVHEKDPNLAGEFKRLTFDKQGETNNTCLKVGEADYLFGRPPGQWARNEKKKSLGLVELAKGRKWQSVMDFPEEIRVTQTIEILPNEQTWKYDTCLVHYLLENRSAKPYPVGIRFLLDTFIGTKDGMPFIVPGKPGLLETQGDYKQDDLPDYIQALERFELTDPGTVAQLGLKLPAFRLNDLDPEPEPISRMVICRFPGQYARWDWDFKPIDENPEQKDSCVVLYWAEQEMPPGSRRAMAFTYGLGRVTSSGSGDLGVTVGSSSIRPDKEFTITAYIKSSESGQKVKINLPKTGGFSLAEGQDQEQTIDKAAAYNQVSWKVRAGELGSYRLEVTTKETAEHIDLEVRPARR